MTSLGSVDLNRLAADEDRFLSRVLQAGVRVERLPANFGDALQAFLRLHATQQARRFRGSLTVDRKALEAGVSQGFSCIECGLEQASGGDLEQALQMLAKGDLEALRRTGYERIWNALRQMRQTVADMLSSRTAPLLGPWHRDLQRWSQVVAETWMARDEEGEPVRLEPARAYAACWRVFQRSRLLESLPVASLEALLPQWDAATAFESFLRQLLVALATEALSLPVSDAAVDHFCATAFSGGSLDAAVRQRALEQLRQQADRSMTEHAPILSVSRGHAILEDMEGAIQRLEQLPAEARGMVIRL